ncbi:VOC family protein [Candidatus Sumerlaeota bacterium]|nr:VOC family protein [Candidatus Sumerlaeota bacterium]
MKLEHVAVNVADPVALAEWYVEHHGMQIAFQLDRPPHTCFLRDSGGKMMLEIYHNPADQVPDYAAMDPLLLHFAFVSADPAADKMRLIQAGATPVSDDVLEDGSHIVMLRDPWGLCIQLCKRSKKLLLDD